MTVKVASSFLVFIIVVLVFAAFNNAKAQPLMVSIETRPTPIATNEKTVMNGDQEKNQADAGPISRQASGVGVSVPVRELPKVAPRGTGQEPREINPQNSIQIKRSTPKTVPEALPAIGRSKKKPADRPKSFKKPIR